MTSVMWFRRDLRVADLPALEAAIEHGPVVPLFVFDDRLLKGRWSAPNRNAFLVECVQGLDAALRERGNRLHFRRGDPRDAVTAFARECDASMVFASRDYTPFARRRDEAVSGALEAERIEFRLFPGTLAQEPEAVSTAGGQPYSMFGPFYRRWAGLPRKAPIPAPQSIPGHSGLEIGQVPAFLVGANGSAPDRLHGGERAAQERLAGWVGNLPGYESGRDRMDREATSRLSQDLKFGTLSPRQVIAAAEVAGAAGSKFVSELAWREFYYHVLWNHPRVLERPFRPEFASLEWDANPGHVQRWKDGETGFPIVDAAMRQLLATGFMHNRARMIVASFLTKDLHIDWRVGQEHFMHHLVDGDVANNNGGWQWAASTGTDPQPYFRIFNPFLQSKRFDPEGAFIRRWVPELRRVPMGRIHEPHRMTFGEQASAGCLIGQDYPAPMVDHEVERRVAMERYRRKRGEATRCD
ncbi:MAG: deoxyribodipyrimidine photo-lyase [Dehalococcoidia bacterium]